jgi:hypothetical protein
MEAVHSHLHLLKLLVLARLMGIVIAILQTYMKERAVTCGSSHHLRCYEAPQTSTVPTDERLRDALTMKHIQAIIGDQVSLRQA